MSNVYKILGLILLITTFSLGILLVQTIGERDVATTDLGNAKAIIKEKDKTLETEKAEKEAAQSDFTGCRAQLELLNQKTSNEAIASQQSDSDASDRANQSLSSLPQKIEQDKLTGQGPTLATRWMKELFK